ncbi:hypothetical protein ACVW00_002375 [Marmoricola sp. URHA0025 HA25]
MHKTFFSPARSRKRSGRRRTVGILGALVVVLSGALVASGPAHAASGPFAIDGTVPDGGATELTDVFGNVKELGPLNSSTTKIGVIHSDAVPTLGTTNPNAQVDLRRAWLKTQRDAGKDWLYFGWERDANSGSGFIAFEFMQDAAGATCDYSTKTDAELVSGCNPWAHRKAGDFMILWDQQGGSKDLSVRTWSGTAPNLVLGPPVTLVASVSEAQYSPDGFRGEAAVNLTDTIFGGSTACKSFANIIPSTVTGNSDSADYKDTILQPSIPVTNCSSSTVTTPKQSDGTTNVAATGLSIGTGVVGVKDSALVGVTGGTATPAGSVAFSLCKVDSANACVGTATTVGSSNLSGTAYPVTVVSPIAYVTSAGRYCWSATFSGDSANGIPSSGDSSAGECFDVNPVSATLSTTASAGVTLGQSVSDSALLGGTATKPANPVINLTGTAGAAADGTITFKLYGPGNCTTLAYTSATVPVSGNGSYSSPAPQFVPTQAGSYHWVATYSGSSPNTSGLTHNGSCTVGTEDVTVSTVASSVSTAQSWVPNDSATVSAPAGGNLNGTLTFTLYPTANCTGTPVYGPIGRTVAGTSPQTVVTSNTTAISAATGAPYSWKVSYSSSNLAQRAIPDSCQETSTLSIANGSTVSSP